MKGSSEEKPAASTASRPTAKPFWKRFGLVFLFGVAFVVIAAIIAVLTTNAWFGIAFFVTAFGPFFLQGWRRIPAQPPTKGVLTIWGKRQPVVKDEGWRFFPFFPWWHGVILVNVTKVNQDLPEQLVRTPDLAGLEVPVSLTWTPIKEAGKDEDGKRGMIEFLNSGGEKGVKTILEDIVRERLREWAISSIEGPQAWQEAIAAKEEAAAILLKAICGSELEPIPSEIPTPILLKTWKRRSLTEWNNYSKPQPNKREATDWGKKWQKLLTQLIGLSAADQEKLWKALEERREQITKARQGNGDFELPQLGITINRLNIGEIKPVGKLAEAAELAVKEEREQAAEIVELDHVRNRMAELMTVPPKGPGFSAEQALEVIQTERGKVVKTVAETKLNISPETRAMIEKIMPGLLNQFASAWKRS